MASRMMILFFLAIFAVLLSSISTAEVVLGEDIRMEATPLEIEAGMPAELNFALDGEFGEGAAMEIRITAPEGDSPLFTGEFKARTRQFLIFNFQEPGPHTIHVTVKDPEDLSAILSKDFVVEVVEAQPPRSAWLRTWGMLMLVLVLGVAIGIASLRFRSSSNHYPKD